MPHVVDLWPKNADRHQNLQPYSLPTRGTRLRKHKPLPQGNNTTTNCRSRYFRLIEGYNCTCESNSDSSNDASNYQHPAVLIDMPSILRPRPTFNDRSSTTYLGSTLQNGSYNPNPSASNDSLLSTNFVCQISDEKSTSK